jgi:cysteine desulfurase
MIYFDNAATTPVADEVLNMYVRLVKEVQGNSASAHGLGDKALKYLEQARHQIRDTLGLKNQNIVFTSGASESNNTAIKGICSRYKKQGKHIITTSVEHASVSSVFNEMEKEGFEVTYLKVDKGGNISLDELNKALRPDTILVSIMGVNNEVGTIYPLKDISETVHNNSHAFFMSDLTQAIGKVSIDFSLLDIFTMSSHKINGLKSSGLLVFSDRINMDPLILGGDQEDGMRAGTSNVPLDCSLATALRIYMGSYRQREEKAQALNEYLRQELKNLGQEAIIVSPEKNVSPFILNFILIHYKASVLVEALSAKEIYVSTRSACSARIDKGSPVLLAMGYSSSLASNAIRLSFEGTEEISEGQEFMAQLKDTISSLRKV